MIIVTREHNGGFQLMNLHTRSPAYDEIYGTQKEAYEAVKYLWSTNAGYKRTKMKIGYKVELV